MAQIKVIKIDGSGFSAEHSSANDSITFKSFDAGSEVRVTGGVTLKAGSVVFTNNAHTISYPSGQVQAQNIADVSAAETISAQWTFSTSPLNNGSIANAKDMVTKEYVDNVIRNIEWQKPVISIISSTPAAQTVGDRYIVASGVSGGIFASYAEYVAEYRTSWIFSQPDEGWAVWVKNSSIAAEGDLIYVYTEAYPPGQWVIMGSVYDHNNLAGLQGGTTGQYYHMTQTEDTWVASAVANVPSANNLVDKTANETISGNWSFTGRVDISGGELSLPNASSVTPADGDLYWNDSLDKVLVYNGSAWIALETDKAKKVVTVYTAGEALSAGDVVYISGTNQVMKARADVMATARAIGIADEAISNGNTGAIMVAGNRAVNGVSTAGITYFLSDSAAGQVTSTPPTGSGRIVLEIGVSSSTTNLELKIGEIKKRA
jgi:hypothetical protein